MRDKFLNCKSQRMIILSCLMLSLIISNCTRPANEKAPEVTERVKPGLEVFLENHVDIVTGKKVGLITNPTGIDSQFRSTIDLFFNHPEIQLTALYGPEHGVRGNAQAGEYVPFYFDEKYRLPVFSLYGQSFKPDPGMLKNIDEYMRSFDIQDTGKTLEKSMVNDLDVLIFDIQDVGTRVYTYVATMAYAMEAAAEENIAFIVLDRPNPIGGQDMEGPMLDFPAFSSFVGRFPIPLRHGLTAGELARLFNEKFLKKKADLTVIPMVNWKREMWFDQTGLPWVIPSPNMPTLDTATVYPGFVILEGTNISEGRGTTRPFEFFGAPWIDGHELARKLNSYHLPGVAFREAWFKPTFSKYQGKLCGGCQVHILDRHVFRPVESALAVVRTIYELYPDKFEFYADYFDKVMGTDLVRKMILSQQELQAIVKSYAPAVDEFRKVCAPYLIY